jgi:Abnormal spindle-like microcephaly-assoc'd, ASPM-SPD-2-Hydin
MNRSSSVPLGGLSPLGRLAAAALAMLFSLALLALASGSAQAKLSAIGPVDAGNNFPTYYQDSNGLRLEPCLTGAPLCFAAASDLVAPAGEAFYNNATANLTTRGNGKATLVLALEAAYAGSGTGQEITFARTRFTDNGGLVPGATYKVTDPYGSNSFVANAAGAVPKNVGTTDIGGLGPCLGPNAHAAGGACDFGVALSGRMGPFLRWDPAVAPAAPAGYVGDAVTPHRIVGSPNGTNVFRIEGPNVNSATTDQCPTVSGPIANCMETNLFTIEGKIAGPLQVTPSKVAFGSQQLGTTSSTQAVTIKNISSSNVTVSSAALDAATGTPGDFKIAGGTCVGASLARDASCTVNVAFAPTATSAVGTHTAALVVSTSASANPERVQLSGSAAAVGTAPAVSVSPAGPIDFGTTRIGTPTGAQAVTIQNTGTADLNVSKVALAGTDATDFTAQNSCVGVAVAPGNTCTVNVVFQPQLTSGQKTATLQITDDASGSPRVVSLTGLAAAGITTVGAVDRTTNFPSMYGDANGVNLQLCLDGPPNCFASRADLVAPAGEAFYNNATAKFNTAKNGKAVMVLALEAAYAGSGTGQEITFSRIRFTDSGGLVPGAQYKVTHPFGVDTYTADSSGAITKKAGTQDTGGLGPCITANAHTAGGVCDFALAATGRFGPFLRWNPAVAPAPPVGYVGDAATPHAIVGSPNGTNLVRVEGPSVNPTPTVDACPTVDGPLADCVEQNQFTVEGKLAP